MIIVSRFSSWLVWVTKLFQQGVWLFSRKFFHSQWDYAQCIQTGIPQLQSVSDILPGSCGDQRWEASGRAELFLNLLEMSSFLLCAVAPGPPPLQTTHWHDTAKGLKHTSYVIFIHLNYVSKCPLIQNKIAWSRKHPSPGWGRTLTLQCLMVPYYL